MLMEIYLSEEKAKKNNIDLNECYQKIDKYFKSRGVEIVSKGIYKGVKEDFGECKINCVSQGRAT